MKVLTHPARAWRTSIIIGSAVVLCCGGASVALAAGGRLSPNSATAAAQQAALSPVRILGPGSQPGLAVDLSGTAYIAWNGPGNPSTLRFCRVPRGGAACAAGLTSTIATAGQSGTRPFITAFGSRVVVLSYRYAQSGPDFRGIFEYTSVNDGLTFGPGVEVGDVPYYDAVNGPGDTMSGVTQADSGGMLFQNVSLTGAGSLGSFAQLSADHPYNGAIGLVDASTPLAVFDNGSSSAQFRKYDGSGPLNDAANWTSAVNLGTADYPKLAGGPTGLFLQAGNLAGKIFVRKYNGSGFNAALSLGAGNAPNQHLFQDAGGRVHSIVEYGDAGGLHLKHWVTDDGIAWRSITVATQNPGVAGAFNDPRIATAADHIGVAVWAAGTAHNIRLVAVGAVPKPKPGLTLTGSAHRTATGVPVSISGTVVRPIGVPASAGCDGTVKVNLERGTATIYTHTVNVTSTCHFGFNTTLGRAEVGAGTARLGVVAKFSGNAALATATKTRTIAIN
jgi:hypothetical protein